MLISMKPLKIAAIGCGSRSRTYLTIAKQFPGQWEIVAGADPVAERVAKIKSISDNPDFQSFSSAEELRAQPKLADVVDNGTQDDYHYEPAKAAIKKGYHLLLEKPACQTLEEAMEISALAQEQQRKVILCFVLRYTPIYKKVKEVVDSGNLGRIVSLRASEGVGAWHQAHSFVRGHWGRSDTSTPMIIAKCSHDLDIISWLMGNPCRRVSSFGSLSYFHSGNRKPGSLDNCFDEENEPEDACPYDARQYLDEDKKNWLKMIYPDPEGIDDTEKVREWLKNSKWGRNVFACDNNVVDHQVVNMEFSDGATAALTMTAFDSGRSIEIYGTEGSLRAGDSVKLHYGKDMVFRHHLSGEIEEIAIEEPENDGYQGHGGGDFGLIERLYDMIHTDSDEGTLQNTIESHRIGFAAEDSRLANGMPIELQAIERPTTDSPSLKAVEDLGC